MTNSDLAGWLLAIRTAPTIEALEAGFMAYLRTPDGWPLTLPKARSRALRQAVDARGWELVAQDPLGHMVPRITRKPSSFRATYRGETFHGGTWGNGAGYRWALAGLVGWVQQVGEFASRHDARTVVDWVLFGMPHRALRICRALAKDQSVIIIVHQPSEE
jgi:hypothetical protein